MNYEQRQAKWLDENGLKIGSKVRVTKSVLYENIIGRKGKIETVGQNAIRIKIKGEVGFFTFPFDCLEPVETRYEVGKEYEVWDNKDDPGKAQYAGYLDGKHWFYCSPGLLGNYANIREIPQVDERVGKWCIFTDEDAFDIKSGYLYAAGIANAKNIAAWKNCMLLSDFVKMVEDGE